jgi:hypothetical protein
MKFSFVCVILLLLTPVVVTATRLSAPAEHDDPDGRELRPPPGGISDTRPPLPGLISDTRPLLPGLISDTRPPLPGLRPISLEECYDVCTRSYDNCIHEREVVCEPGFEICKDDCAMEFPLEAGCEAVLEECLGCVLTTFSQCTQRVFCYSDHGRCRYLAGCSADLEECLECGIFYNGNCLSNLRCHSNFEYCFNS